MSISSVSTSLAIASSPFERAAYGAIPSLAEHISTQEARVLELTCRTIRAKIADVMVRQRVTYAHFSNPRTEDVKFAFKLERLAFHFPALSSLELNISNLTGAGLETLAKAPQLPKITRLTLYGDAIKMGLKGALNALFLLIKNLDFSQLEIFDLGRAGSLPRLPTKLVLEMLTRCKVLKVFCLHEMHSLFLESQEFFAHLPGTLEELGPFMTDTTGKVSQLLATDAFIEQFRGKCANPKKIKKCDLRFIVRIQSSDIGISSRKLDQLLNFLPLSELSHLRLVATGMGASNLSTLTSQLQLNSNLIELRIAGTNGGLPTILALLKSIRSLRLQELVIEDASLKLSLKETPINLLKKVAATIRKFDQAQLSAKLPMIAEGSQECSSQS